LTKFCRILMATILAFSSQVGHASTWHYVGSDTSGAVWHLDQGSIRSRSDSIYVWVEIIDFKSKITNSVTTKERYKISCSNWTMRVLNVITYDSNSLLIGSKSYTDYTSDFGMDGIAPETMADAVARFVCPL